MLGPKGSNVNEIFQHHFNEKDVCIYCACSKSFSLKNNIACKPLPKDENYYRLQYWSIFEMFDHLREGGLNDCAENVSIAFKGIHPLGDIPIDKLNWWVEQWGKYRKEMFKIYIKGIEQQLKDPDKFTGSTFMDKYWKDPEWT